MPTATVHSLATETFYANPTLFGHDATAGIVAVETGEPGTVRLWRRVEGKVVLETVTCHPFVWVESAALLEGGPPPLEVRQLQGGGSLNTLVHFADAEQFAAARKHLHHVSGETPGSPSAPYRLLPDFTHQYLLESGRTSFKNMTFQDVVRMQIDIAAQCDEGFEFANPQREEDRILAVGISTNRGFSTVLQSADMGEKDLLLRLGEIVAAQDPDIIEGHDVFRFVLEYIRVRAQRHKVKLLWGRDGSAVTRRASRVQIAERTIDYPRYDIIGRHVLDTWLLAQYYDITDRSLPSFDLFDVARHTGAVPAEERPAASRLLQPQPEQLHAVCLQRLQYVGAISDMLAPIYFLQAQMFPYSFQNVIVRGNATRIDALFLREYLRRGQALPSMATNPPSYEGGYTDIFEQGVVGPVLQVDVASLYPSLMLTFELKPQADELGIFLSLLRDLFEFRLQAKALARSAQLPEARAYYGALQSTFKILINSFYGYLGTSFCHFADGGMASEVTRHGRELVHSMLDWLRGHGCRPIEADTDGVYFIPAKGTSEESLLEELGKILPSGIRVELGGRYAAMFAHKAKNYALLDENGELIIRGSGLRSRGMEKYLREFLEEMLSLILRGRGSEVKPLLHARLDDVAARRTDIGDLCKNETLSETLDSYKKKVAAKKRNAAAAYELAIQSGRSYKPGDAISYYVAGQGKKVKVYEACKSASAWLAAAPDENVEYYQQKLIELARKFEEYYG